MIPNMKVLSWLRSDHFNYNISLPGGRANKKLTKTGWILGVGADYAFEIRNANPCDTGRWPLRVEGARMGVMILNFVDWVLQIIVQEESIRWLSDHITRRRQVRDECYSTKRDLFTVLLMSTHDDKTIYLRVTYSQFTCQLLSLYRVTITLTNSSRS